MKGLVIYPEQEFVSDIDNRMHELEKRMPTIKYKDKTLIFEKERFQKDIEEINPDFILGPPIIGDYGIPKILGSSDVWGDVYSEAFKKIVKDTKPDGIYTNCNCTIPVYKDYFKDLNIDLDYFFFNWGFNPEIIKDYGEEKIWDIIQSGKFSTYEFRRDLDYVLSGITNLKYKRFGPYNVTKIPFDEYAKNINRSLMGIGGCVQNRKFLYYNDIFIGNTFAKTLEIPGCRSTLLNSHFGDEEYLGLIDGVNCILFNNIRDALRKIDYYMANKEELIDITESGFKLANDKFTAKVSVDNFLKEVENTYG